MFRYCLRFYSLKLFFTDSIPQRVEEHTTTQSSKSTPTELRNSRESRGGEDNWKHWNMTATSGAHLRNQVHQPMIPLAHPVQKRPNLLRQDTRLIAKKRRCWRRANMKPVSPIKRGKETDSVEADTSRHMAEFLLYNIK